MNMKDIEQKLRHADYKQAKLYLDVYKRQALTIGEPPIKIIHSITCIIKYFIFLVFI